MPASLIGLPLIISVNIFATAWLYRRIGGRLLKLLLFYWIAAFVAGALIALSGDSSPIVRVGAYAFCFALPVIDTRIIEILSELPKRDEGELLFWLLALVLTAVLFASGAPPFWLALPLAASAAFPGFRLCLRVIARGKSNAPFRSVGVVISMLGAVHMLDFPFFYMNPRLLTFGYFLGFTLVVAQMAFVTSGIIERVMRTRLDEREQEIRLRDEFLSMASHELKTPITALKLIMQFAERVASEDGGVSISGRDLRRNLATALTQVDRLTALINELLDVVKIRTGNMEYQPEPVDLSELVRDIMSRYSPQLEAAHCPPDTAIEPGVTGRWDRSRIEQVLVNLMSNAVKYAPGKPVRVAVRRQGGFAEVSVADRGPGIPAQLHEKIFERFARGDSSAGIGGLGLGLYIVKQIVDAHGGSIHLESEPGRGAVFNVRLPLGGAAPGSDRAGRP